MNPGVTWQQVCSAAHLVSFMQQFQLKCIKQNLTSKFLAIVVAKQHASRSKHSQLNFVFLLRLFVYPNANLLKSLFYSRFALVLSLYYIKAKWPYVVSYKILHPSLLNLRQSFKIIFEEILSYQTILKIKCGCCHCISFAKHLYLRQLAQRIIYQNLVSSGGN